MSMTVVLKQNQVPVFEDGYLWFNNTFILGCYECKNTTELLMTVSYTNRQVDSVLVTCGMCGEDIATTEDIAKHG